MPFTGELTIPGEVRPLRAEIDITPTDLVVSTGLGPVGRWPLEVCHVEPDNGRFLLAIDDEVAWFVPDDAVTFTRQVLDRWGAANLASAVKAVRDATEGNTHESPGQLAAQPISGVRSFNDLAQRLRGIRPIHLAGIVLVLIFLLVIAATLGRGGDRRTALGTIPLTTTTTVFPAVFSSGLNEVTPLWNEAADDLGVDLFLFEIYPGARMQVDLPGDLILYGTESPSGRVRTLMVSAGPSDDESGATVLAAWGTLIAVANPELDPEGRRTLLDRLGVDVNRPLTFGLDTETVEGGASYWLRSGVLGGRVHFGVQPAR